MSTADTLPNDILFEILSLVLHVPDAKFATLSRNASATSPFLTRSQSSSAYLLVSKSWLYVGTPLLYNTVVLRSKAQAQALAATLTTNPDLGRFIKKLRVEGGFEDLMHTILALSRNITDIFITLNLASSDNPRGLCTGLPLINPVRVIVETTELEMTPRVARELYMVIQKCVGTWRQLVQFESSLLFVFDETMSQLLNQASCLHSLVLWNKYDARHLQSTIEKMAKNPALKSIRFVQGVSSAKQGYDQDFERVLYDLFKEKPRFIDMLNLADSDEKAVIRPQHANSFAYPAQLQADPILEDAIWSRILFFALERDASDVVQNHFRVALLTVCRMFKRLGIPNLYRNVRLSCESSARLFASRLEQYPALGCYIRTIFFHYPGNTMPIEFDKIVLYAPSLTELDVDTCQPISWDSFRRLGESAGTTLRFCRGLEVFAKNGPANADFFALFSQLETLRLRFRGGFWTDLTTIPKDCFPSLANLTIDGSNVSLLDTLAYMELPSIRTLVFNSRRALDGSMFLKRHGRKLQQLTLSEFQMDRASTIWHNCPSLKSLCILCNEPKGTVDSGRWVASEPRPVREPASWFSMSETYVHRHLQRIIFSMTDTTSKTFCLMLAPSPKQFNDLVNTIRTTTSFPALREIEHPLCKWPIQEYVPVLL
ncbi:hypothetical protein R3P38DRAFT_3168110 [Favolaschia claudopus]|uniref:F-box domain-containing protein n=1 Tax=Favolaschia claudopus TaxID=2862362 RepID=A0AAW0E327_9AGAR